MPSVIVHEIGKEPREAFITQNAYTIGRESNCDLCLTNVSVSRRHAVLQKQSDEHFWIQPLSSENSVLVNGETVEGAERLEEGAHIQIGRYFLIFSLLNSAPQDYRKQGTQFVHVQCKSCHWHGMLSGHRFKSMSNPPVCPQCGHGDFERLAGPASVESPKPAQQQRPPVDEIITSASTMVLSPEQMKVYADRLARAKTARIERIGGRSDLPKSLELSDSKVVTFGKLGKAEMPIEGFCFGAPPSIKWRDDAYHLEKGGFKPAVTINGEKIESARLLSGVIFKVGNSQFRFVNE